MQYSDSLHFISYRIKISDEDRSDKGMLYLISSSRSSHMKLIRKSNAEYYAFMLEIRLKFAIELHADFGHQSSNWECVLYASNLLYMRFSICMYVCECVLVLNYNLLLYGGVHCCWVYIDIFYLNCLKHVIVFSISLKLHAYIPV